MRRLYCGTHRYSACLVLFFGRIRTNRKTKVVSHLDLTTKKIYHASVNACLAPLVSVDGKHVITVEGIGDVKSPHPVQQRIAVGNGSQCGFCTPGIVMVSQDYFL